jgi:hypothetical protein
MYAGHTYLKTLTRCPMLPLCTSRSPCYDRILRAGASGAQGPLWGLCRSSAGAARQPVLQPRSRSSRSQGWANDGRDGGDKDRGGDNLHIGVADLRSASVGVLAHQHGERDID